MSEGESRGSFASPRTGLQGAGGVVAVLAGAVALVALAVGVLPGIPQAPEYHLFADRRQLLGVPNALDVLSSAAFVAVGALGLLVLHRRAGAAEEPGRPAWRVLFWGVIATGLGSAWYHLDPTNDTLVWDRLPMAVGFMALLSALVAERLHAELGRRLLAPLVLAGVASVAYWYLGELRGEGNLVPYAIVQFGTLAAIPLVLLAGRGRDRADWMIALGLYALSKGLEVSDAAVLDAVGVSGHTLKHLFAAAGIGWLVRMLSRRAAVS
jgi:hypothetical protein